MEELTLEQFCEKVKTAVSDFFDSEVEVRLQHVMKNNGVKLTGITIMETDGQIAPTIYLNDAFEVYKRDKGLGKIVKKVIEVYENNRVGKDFDISFFSDYRQVKNKLTFRLINKEMNRELLADVPYEEFCDLALVCYCTIVREDIGNGSILIKNEHIKLWNIEKDELIQAAKVNMPRIFPMEFKSMLEIMKEMLPDEEQENMIPCIEEIPMYILTNTCRINGAASMVYENVLENIAKNWNCDFYILPSSIHEVILIPAKEDVEKASLSKMVHEINMTQLQQEEILAHHAYLYNYQTGQIEILPLILNE